MSPHHIRHTPRASIVVFRVPLGLRHIRRLRLHRPEQRSVLPPDPVLVLVLGSHWHVHNIRCHRRLLRLLYWALLSRERLTRSCLKTTAKRIPYCSEPYHIKRWNLITRLRLLLLGWIMYLCRCMFSIHIGA